MFDNNSVYIKVFCHEIGEIVLESIEKLVRRMVAIQAPIDFHMEMLKVQAIIARTQLVRNTRIFGGEGCSKHEGCDICDEGHCVEIACEDYLKEIWKEDYNRNIEKLNKAIRETEGLIITINNKPINPKYHHTCGGSTENSEKVMGNQIVYLRKVLCDYCSKSPKWDGYKELSIQEIEKRLNIKFPKLVPSLETDIKGFIDEIDRDDQGRVETIKIGGKKFKGTDVMRLLDLDSTRFSVAPVVIRFNTRGKGEGLGLCQYGGNEMAVNGYNFEEIIKYYYTGVEIKRMEKPCIRKPLSGRIIIIDPGHGGDSSVDYVGPNGLREKDIVLDIGLKVSKSLRELGAIVYLTREKDEYVSLNKRAELGNKIRPNFFISLHLNSFPNPSIHGCEIYHYKNDKDSEILARAIMNSLVKNLDVLDRGIKTADFFLLREVGVSSLQLEIDYISNPDQERKLSNKNYVNKVVKAIVQGIVDYYKY